ncbi:hypothetical protein JTB14_004094 [Gonioctena quinquepunctata]|nr:hypothetical protein JTB14_004094 [Gonioctena quinquepunctata]
MEISRIKKTFESSKVFITGGTGFMGKIMLEKLLRTTEVSTIYVLVRHRQCETIHQTIEELFQNEIFKRMKDLCPNYREKIQPIVGDCSVADLGLCDSDRRTLIENTNFIFHMAATVRFNADLKSAYRINVCGTKYLILMAKQMKNLKVSYYFIKWISVNIIH